jgi:hypothetical protein
LEVWHTTAKVTRVLLDWLGLPVNEKTVLFHRDDPRTSKDCPGAQITKDWVISLIKSSSNVKSSPVIAPAKTAIIDSKNFVPLAATLFKKGFSDKQIKKYLHREGKNFFWLDDHLEFAYYDPKTETTMVPLSEISDKMPAFFPA